MLSYNIETEENLTISYSNKMDVLCVTSSIFGKVTIDLQKIQYISIQKKNIQSNSSHHGYEIENPIQQNIAVGSYRKIFITINFGNEYIEYSFEISDQEKAVKFFQEIEKYYYANLKEERNGIQELYDKFGINPNN